MHHALATLLWSTIWPTTRELALDGLLGIPVLMDSINAWQRMCHELGGEDLILPDADFAFISGIRRNRPDTGPTPK